jgi:DNA-binding IscR family transcriptional regulator
MRIPARADYTVRALLEPTVRQDDGPPVKAEAIATAQTIPYEFVEGIHTDVRRGGLVADRCGGKGGHAPDRSWRPIRLTYAGSPTPGRPNP